MKAPGLGSPAVGIWPIVTFPSENATSSFTAPRTDTTFSISPWTARNLGWWLPLLQSVPDLFAMLPRSDMQRNLEWGEDMKKVRVIIAGAVLASSFLVVGASPANASCAGEPNVCQAVCAVGLGNKYTRDLFAWCYIT